MDRRERPGLVERRERRQRLDPGDRVGVEHDGRREARAAMDDAVADRARRRPARDRVTHDTRIGSLDRRQVGRPEHGIVVAQQPQLAAARPRVDDERQACGVGHVQPATSGASSPSSRVYARAWSRRSTISWRTCPAFDARPGTRSMTSITRWNRSRSLSMTMSNGVVVVPSSLYPRTWRLAWFVRRYVRRWMSHG